MQLFTTVLVQTGGSGGVVVHVVPASPVDFEQLAGAEPLQDSDSETFAH
jgi:hypothetical protein